MKHIKSFCPSFEVLENRLTPTIAVVGGNLIVTGSFQDLVIQGTSNTKYTVIADGKVVPESGVTGDIRVQLSGTGGANVNVDLGGNLLGGSLQIQTGGGSDKLLVRNGAVGKDIDIDTGAGKDSVQLGDGLTKLNVNRNVTVDTLGDNADSLTIKTGVLIQHDLLSRSNKLVVEQNVQIQHDATIAGSLEGNALTIAGNIGHDLVFSGSSKPGASDQLTLTTTGAVGHDVNAQMDGPFSDFLCGNKDTVVLNGLIAHNLTLDTGLGNDHVTFGPNLFILGSAAVTLGGGNDLFTYNTPKPVPITAIIDGGTGNDTFVGDANKPGTVKLKRFEHHS